MAGVEIAKAYVSLVPQFDGVSKEIRQGLGDIDGEGSRAGRALGTGMSSGFRATAAVGVAAVAAGLVGVKALASGIGAAISRVSDMNTIAAQTSAVIKATGNAAGVTADGIHELAESIQDTTATESEAIQEGANLLLTFKNIRNEAGEGNDVFNQSTVALVDMARAMGQEPAAAAVQLGKALNDPIQGISALSRVGVQFTDDQKELIKTLVESGDVMGAQKIILAELNSQFGGSGAAYADTYAGKIETLRDKFEGLSERLVTSVMPALLGIADFGISALDQFNSSPLFQSIIDKFLTLNDHIPDFAGFQAFLNNLSTLGAAGTIQLLLDQFGQSSPIFAALSAVFAAMQPVMPTVVQAFKDLVPPASELLVALAPLIPPLVQMVVELLPPLVQLVKDLTPALQGLIEHGLKPAAADLGALATSFSGFSTIIGNVDNPKKQQAALEEMRDAVRSIPGPLGVVATGFVNAGEDFQHFLEDAIKNMSSFFFDVGANLSKLPTIVGDAVSGAGTWLFNSGKAIVQGLIDGIKSMIGAVGTAAGSVMDAIANFFPHSPAKEGPFSGSGWTALPKSGQAIMEQFTSGMSMDVGPHLTNSLSRLAPSSLTASYGSGGGLTAGAGVTINGNVYGDPDHLADAIARRQRRAASLAGLRGVAVA